MPDGTYLLAGCARQFSCATKPTGWRYTDDFFDLMVDRAFELVRFQMRQSAHDDTPWTSGGRVTDDEGRRAIVWHHSSRPGRQLSAVVAGLWCPSPGALAALANHPRRRDEGGLTLPVLSVHPETLVAVQSQVNVEVINEYDHEGMTVTAVRIVEGHTGEKVELALVDDVIAAGQTPWGDIELTALN